MDRQRFEVLLDAYGADFARWPAEERDSGAAFAAAHAGVLAAALAEARALDAALRLAQENAPDVALLERRILAKAPRADGIDRRAGWALAACVLLGIVLGYGAGLSAPVADGDHYLELALEAPFGMPGEDG